MRLWKHFAVARSAGGAGGHATASGEAQLGALVAIVFSRLVGVVTVQVADRLCGHTGCFGSLAAFRVSALAWRLRRSNTGSVAASAKRFTVVTVRQAKFAHVVADQVDNLVRLCGAEHVLLQLLSLSANRKRQRLEFGRKAHDVTERVRSERRLHTKTNPRKLFAVTRGCFCFCVCVSSCFRSSSPCFLLICASQVLLDFPRVSLACLSVCMLTVLLLIAAIHIHYAQLPCVSFWQLSLAQYSPFSE